ncbi:azurin [Pusillimonas sp. ANT_WB101]|uniref:azurin n=1 Tax=Pusillimonas sp. ANT_WB101 TaxID=2597356 RepID=UPI0011EF29FA|nr:azurin [Pusillimonas sp. ANT_WB101]KAA0911040.1 azurin [Pusillimonas sp. ANT_WB101]
MLVKATFAALLSVMTLPAFAADCAVTVESNDAMQFNTKEIVIDKTCKDFTVKLLHVGKLPAAAMGHNWVLTKEADKQAVATEGMKAGAAKDYVDDADPRVLAHTKVIGGGEETSVTFDVSKLSADEKYNFFCSFPGHYAIMHGVVKLSD